jgi:AcrR family transcriptional regulator
MPRPKQSEEDREAMRERILDAAHELFTEEGFDALSIRAIADRVGVSHMVLYTYFDNRDTLTEALRSRQRERMQTWRAEVLQQAEDGDVVAVTRDVLGRYAALARERPKMYQFIWVQSIPQDMQQHEPHRPFCGNVRYLAQLVQLGIDRGIYAPRDATVVAATVFAIVHAPLLLYHNGRLTDAELRDQMSAEALEAAMGYLMR